MSSVSLLTRPSVLHEIPCMGTQEWLVERFRALCARVGGVEVVAEATGLSAESLSQVIKGYRLQKSQNPRGLGPTAIRKLDAAYPDWFMPEAPKIEAEEVPPLARRIADQIEAVPEALRAGALASVAVILDTMSSAQQAGDAAPSRKQAGRQK